MYVFYDLTFCIFIHVNLDVNNVTQVSDRFYLL